MADAGQKEEGGLFSSVWSMGASAYNLAAQTVNSVAGALGFEDLAVVDPDAAEAAGGAAAPPDARATAFAGWRDYLGKDITSLVILPVWIMQPFSMLQNMAEIMEYTSCLDAAATAEDPAERLARVAAFTMGPFAAVERPWKPFNPILGETFELRRPEAGVRFIAEQVSHHPPIGASHADSPLWEYGLVSAPRTKFLGNSVEVYPVGRTRITLKTTGETFSLVPPPAKAHNVVIGKTWVESFGEYNLLNATTGARARLQFTPCGWFGAGRYEVAGHVEDAAGAKLLKLEGKWNSHLDMLPCDAEGAAAPDAPRTRLWTCRERPAADPYAFTHFAHELNACAGTNPLASDSRRRPDRAALELGRSGESAAHKHALEELQRAERRRRDAEGAGWAPRWFRAVPPEAATVVTDVAAGEAAKGAGVLPGECGTDECPLFEFTGEWLERAAGPACEPAAVQGAGFCPWQFPEMHAENPALRPASLEDGGAAGEE